MSISELHPTITVTPTDEADVIAIRNIIADIQTAFNTNDADLMNAHFATNASAVNAVGGRIVGYDALQEAAAAGLAGFLHDQYVRYDVTDVEFPRPDVALAYKTAQAVDVNDEPIGIGHQMVATYVLTKESGRWWIIARHNTPVPEQ